MTAHVAPFFEAALTQLIAKAREAGYLRPSDLQALVVPDEIDDAALDEAYARLAQAGCVMFDPAVDTELVTDLVEPAVQPVDPADDLGGALQADISGLAPDDIVGLHLREISRIPSPVQRIWRARDAEIAPSHASTRLQALAMKRPVDLVWRANMNATMTADAAPRSATTSASSVRSSAGAAVPSSPASRPDTNVVCATALDPALADRFADDVIRRIDRRARIERERRGP